MLTELALGDLKALIRWNSPTSDAPIKHEILWHSYSESRLLGSRDGAFLPKATGPYAIVTDGDREAVSDDKAVFLPDTSRVEVLRVELAQKKFILLPVSGLIVVVGATGTGKTENLRYLGTKLADSGVHVGRIMFCEPEEREDATFDPYEFLQQLVYAIASPNIKVIALDSLRYFTYAGGSGAAGKGGINMKLFAQLTGLAALARRFGKLILATHNPLVADAESLRAYVESANGSVSGVINCISPGTIEYSHRSPLAVATRTPITLNIPMAEKINQSIEKLTSMSIDSSDSDEEESF